MVSASLIPVGMYCFYKAHKRRDHKIFWPFALYPLVFGIQQAMEGWLWLSFETGSVESLRIPALSFVFFSHFFWLFWIPYSCYTIETADRKKRLFFFTTIMGSVSGLAMLLPVIMYADWMSVSLIRHSISYELKLLFDDFVPRIAVRGFYVLIILVPLLLSSWRFLRYFGVIIALSVLMVVSWYSETFISVWCFFAAIMSAYMLTLFICLGKQKTVQFLK